MVVVEVLESGWATRQFLIAEDALVLDIVQRIKDQVHYHLILQVLKFSLLHKPGSDSNPNTITRQRYLDRQVSSVTYEVCLFS